MVSLDNTPPDQVGKTETMARRGTRSPICGNQRSPPQSSNKEWKSHRQLFHPDWGSSVWRTDGHAGRPAASKSTPSETLVVSIETGRG